MVAPLQMQCVSQSAFPRSSLIFGAENLIHFWTWSKNGQIPFLYELDAWTSWEKSLNSSTQKTRPKARAVWTRLRETKGTLTVWYPVFSTAGRLMQLNVFWVGLSLCSGKAVIAWRFCAATRSLEQQLQCRGELLTCSTSGYKMNGVG